MIGNIRHSRLNKAFYARGGIVKTEWVWFVMLGMDCGDSGKLTAQ